VVDVTDPDEVMPLAAWDDDPGLRELLARAVEVPPEPPSTPPERGLVEVQMPELSPEATVLDELDRAAVGAVRTLKWAMQHGETTAIKVTAARAVLQAAMARWQHRMTGDPLGEFVKSVMVPDGPHP